MPNNRIRRALFGIAGIASTIILGLITNYIWALIVPESKAATIVREYYPVILADLVPPKQPVADPPRPTPSPTLEVRAEEKPPAGEALVPTPANASVTAHVLPPLKSDERNVRVTLSLASRVDAQKIFVAQDGRLLDWSGRIVESGAVCWTGYGEITGIKSFYADRWKESDVYLDQLSSSIASHVDTTFICDKPVRVGETFFFKARFDAVTDVEKTPITFTSAALRIAERR